MRRIAVPFLILFLATACSFAREQRRSSSLMDFIYPNATDAPPLGNAKLQLPLRVGIAFVPVQSEGRGGWNRDIPAETEQRLLSIVKKSFQGRDWVKDIQIIPSSYLQPGGGFKSLDQVSRLFGTDVVVLASVDQIQNSNPTPLSFLYLSVIGAYVLPLDHNETRTMVDAAVFHVPSRTFLLRAPGTSRVAGLSTAVGVTSAMQQASYKGFEEAIGEVSKNLDREVESFKAQVIAGERADVDVINKSGTSIQKSGSVSWYEAAAAVMLLMAAAWMRRTHSL
jgi:rhombotail lipoprotein